MTGSSKGRQKRLARTSALEEEDDPLSERKITQRSTASGTIGSTPSARSFSARSRSPEVPTSAAGFALLAFLRRRGWFSNSAAWRMCEPDRATDALEGESARSTSEHHAA
jgi:hypothetical protein